MAADEREPLGEAAPERSPEEVAGKAESHEYPTMGKGGDMTGDDESLARRPPQDEDEFAADTDKGGMPPGKETHGA